MIFTAPEHIGGGFFEKGRELGQNAQNSALEMCQNGENLVSAIFCIAF
jgi:hypothetical protein